ncbi:DUF839 domain-containing protein [Haloechinothrix sp. YIM 98757]|uniref:DUF839 domain-containing protein n=1 Tax=Haloechinothrix aidingensis TaxID=2752311 RepID=A0A838AFS8_9PSEU|nr:alkaline phosphatase PhoX [Haloechinothrix aidingensis]MBA0128196.1 DUF839 domain-containing protein [Haloechinothrix aidingensis]
MAIDRRDFMRRAAVAGAGSLLAGGPFHGFVAHASQGSRSRHGNHPLGYGPLEPTPDERDGAERLLLPRGFRYRSFHPSGDSLGDGVTVPGFHDGMAAFRGSRGRTALVRNHEVNGPVGAFGDTGDAYDAMAGGGTTTVLVDGFGNVEDSFVSLNGTQMNCAGGPMPWGSWITCEETVNGPDVGPDFTGGDNTKLEEKHGYIFDVPSGGRSAAEPVRAAGRFAHEAAAYCPHDGAVYLTEDNFGFPSGFYRYRPPVNPRSAGRLVDGGRLEMLAITGRPNADLGGVDGPAPEVGSVFDCEWVTIDDPDPTFTGTPSNDEAVVAVGEQGRAAGAALFARLEGAVEDRNTIYFCSTQGGNQPSDAPAPPGYGNGRGQIWAYHAPTSTLRLVYESPSQEVLDMPDNVTTSRRNTLVLCEDGVNDTQYLRGLTTDGEIVDFAKNNIEGQTGDEFAGTTFSPDKQTLYVNIQSSSGLTCAIWGPWGSGGF